MDAKTQIEPDLTFFYDGQKLWRQCVKVIDTMRGHIYFLTSKHFR